MHKISASVPADLKNGNRGTVLAAFHNSGMLTAAEVSERTGISRQTVKKCIEYHLQIGALCSCGKGDSTTVGGKRPERFTLNPRVRLMSILLHHHEVTLNMTDLHYNCVAHWSSGPVRLLCMDMMWEQIRRGAREIMERYPDSRVLGICFPVPLGYTTEKRLSAATPFPAWPRSDFGRSLTEPLQEIFPDARDIIITSDGKAAGSALLHWDFSRYGQGEVATFYCSTGIGGALFRDGQPTTGTKSLVGALGHIIVEPDDPEPCPCGGHGCLERMVSSGRMRERLAAQEEEYRKSCLKEIPVAEMTFEKLFEGSAKGDVLCRRESRYYAQIFSIAIRGLIVSVAPEYVVFQGNFGKADEVFRRELLNKVFEFKYMDRQEKIEFVYDDRDLSMEETVGATYQMINNFLCFPEKYVWKQENVGRALTLPE